MGWLNTVLDLASVGIDIANYQKISQLQKVAGDQQRSAAVQAIIDFLKQEVFKYRQATEEILVKEEQSPLIAAGALKLLETNLDESPIKPELFPDLADKDYVANTIRLIHTNGTRLMNQLTSQEKEAVYQMIQASKTQADTSYYIENYSAGHQLLNAEEAYERLKGRNTAGFRNGVGCGVLIIALVLYGLLFSATNGSVPVMIIFGVASLAGIIYLYRYIGRKEFQDAKKVIDKYDDEIDQELFKRMDIKMSGNLQRAREIEQDASGVVDRFFAGETVISTTAALPIEAAVTDTSKSNNNQESVQDPSSLVPQESGEEPQTLIEDEVENGEKLDSSEPELQFCIHCGERTVPGATYCGICGGKLVG